MVAGFVKGNVANWKISEEFLKNISASARYNIWVFSLLILNVFLFLFLICLLFSYIFFYKVVLNFLLLWRHFRGSGLFRGSSSHLPLNVDVYVCSLLNSYLKPSSDWFSASSCAADIGEEQREILTIERMPLPPKTWPPLRNNGSF